MRLVPIMSHCISALKKKCRKRTRVTLTEPIPLIIIEIHQVAAMIVEALKKKCLILQVEQMFTAENSTDRDIQCFQSLMKHLKTLCDEQKVAPFSSKLQAIVTECKKNQTFHTLFLTIWIKFECSIKDLKAQMKKEIEQDDEISNEGQLEMVVLNERADNIVADRLAVLLADVLDKMDDELDKTFYPEGNLPTCERMLSGSWLLWVITQTNETYFYFLYRNSSKMRRFHHFVQPCVTQFLYCFHCCHILVVHVTLLIIGALTYVVVSRIIK